MDLDPHQLGDQLQKATILLGHAMNKISWYRRLHILSRLGKHADVKKLLQQEKVKTIFKENQTNELFPKEFDEHLKDENVSRKNVLSALKPTPVKQQKKQPAKAASSTTQKQQPFPSIPFQRGGGNSHQSDRKWYNNPFSKGQNSGGNIETFNPFCNHALPSGMAPFSEGGTPLNKRTFSPIKSSLTSSRESTKISRKLEVSDWRSKHHGYSERVGNPFTRNTSPNLFTTRGKNECRRGESHGSGSQEHVAKGSYQGGYPKARPVSEQYLCDPERGRSISANNKPKETEPLCTLPSFQDGGSQGCEKHPEKGGLDVQVGPERCILLSSTQPLLSETGPVYVEGSSVRIPVSGLRAKPCPKNFYQNDENSDYHFEETGDPSSDISGRYSSDRVVQTRIRDGKGHSHVPFSPFGTDSQPKEISSGPKTTDRVFRSPSGQQLSHILPSPGKMEKLKALCQDRYASRVITVRNLCSLIGKLRATAPAVIPAPLQLRYLQQALISAQTRKLSRFKFQKRGC